ncbi:serine/threonine protein kinase [Stenomitos frigidus ULC18]|uniref:non-specific serine/threonine protein kinase n=1 Tax=Stenomitos frigidus ULC18 TaxID=2107698 RepID=A0A2T1E5L1_9CYAN|nr:serine/threonine protein kinase [Stenomitos frigidus ULC18]
MNRSVTDLFDFRADLLDQTHLGKLCGSGQRFLDRYEILKILGRGGFGITFLARDAALPGQPLCVIKQLCPKVNDAVALQQARKRFEKEAATLSKLGSHAQIPQLLNYFETAGEFYLVQEYVRGFTLTKTVKRYGPFSEAGVKQFLREFLPLLQYVHNNRVIHRDIKPPNLIRCRDDGRLVLIDFGAVKEQIAKISDSGAKPTTTQFVGTLGFAPPEQLASRPIYSSDIYALGVTCLYLLSGKPPLEFDYEFLTGDVRWSEYVSVSEHFGTVLSKMLKVSPQERFQSVDEVIRALELEPYFDNLVHCMNIKPKPFLHPATADEATADSYVPPVARTAMAIRDWQAKLKARRMRDRLYQPRITHSGSSYFR